MNRINILGKMTLSLIWAMCLSYGNCPRISIITSLYNADQFISNFMADITQQTIFDQCELIIINANSPGNEDFVISNYLEKYNNIRYIKLAYDPGLYAVWNMAIKMARADYITNANVDDALKFDCYEVHARTLDQHPEVEVVYSDFYVTNRPNETFSCNTHSRVRRVGEFCKKNMWECLPNNHPMWRKSLHTKYGFFDEHFKHVGDYEMWLRAVKGGAKFLKVSGIYGLFYYNPHGLSTSYTKQSQIQIEEQEIRQKYADVFK